MKAQRGPKDNIKLEKIVFGDLETLNLVVNDNFERTNLGENIHDPLFPHKINIKAKSGSSRVITFCDIQLSQIFGYYHSFDSCAFYLIVSTEYDVKNKINKYLGTPDGTAEVSTSNNEDMNMSLTNWSVGNHEIYLQKVMAVLNDKASDNYLITITNIPLKDLFNFLNRKAF